MPRLDLLRRQLVVEQQLITLQGRAPYLASPKTPASVRQVPLPLTVVDAVAAHLAAFDTVCSAPSSVLTQANRCGVIASPSASGVPG